MFGRDYQVEFKALMRRVLRTAGTQRRAGVMRAAAGRSSRPVDVGVRCSGTGTHDWRRVAQGRRV
jgi:hypothetical protein